MKKLDNAGKVSLALAVLLLMGFALVQDSWAQQSAEELYEAAILKKETEGDLAGAVKLFQQVLASFPDNRAIAAKAQLQIGLCHEKLGYEEALKAYQLVLKNYGDQEEPVSIARARLAELQAKTPIGPSVSQIPSEEDELYIEAATLSPDGTKLLGIHISTPRGQNVVYKDVATGKIEFITKFDWEGEGSGWTYDAVWAPDSMRVAFRFDGMTDPLQELCVSDLRGNSQTIYKCKTETEEIYPVDWFPDGKTLLAIQMFEKKLIKLVSVPFKGERLDVLYELIPPKGISLRANADEVIKADLSPSGEHIVFHEHKNGSKDIYIMDTSKRIAKVLMDSPAENWRPCWSPDGKHIAFMSDRAGGRDIWAVPMDHAGNVIGQSIALNQMQFGNLRSWSEKGIYYTEWIAMLDIYTMPVDPLTGEPAAPPQQLDFYPMGRNLNPVWSPDGKHLAFLSDPDDLSIVIYPLSGGDVLKFKTPFTVDKRVSLGPMSDLHWLSDSSGLGLTVPYVDEAADDQFSIKRRLHVLKIETGKWTSPDIELPRRSNFVVWDAGEQSFYFARSHVGIKDPEDPGIIEHNVVTGEELYLYRPPDSERGLFPSLRISRDYSKLAVCAFRFSTLIVLDTISGKILDEIDKFWAFPAPPAWSPDGTLLMTMTGKPTDKLLVYSLKDRTKKVYDVKNDLLSKGQLRNLDWSPDGKKIAFTWNYSRGGDYIHHNPIPIQKK
ncbi:tetratricopeptide repeat protein [Acidobacteriota bacterium]